MQTQELKSRTIKGLVLLILREGLIKVVAIVGQLILVRLLLPQYFGVVAILTFLVNTADLFTDLGLVSGIIRSRVKPDHATLSSLFWIKFGLTFAATALILLAAPLFKLFFPALGNGDMLALRILSLTLLFRPIKTVILGLLERELRYDAVPMVDIGGLLVYFAVAIMLAVMGWGVWSLVWSIMVKDAVELVILQFVNPFVPSFIFSWKQAKTYMRFGAPLQGNTILGFLSQSTIPFLGGVLSTPAAVGLLDWGFNIASIPRVISYNVGRIALPSFSRVQGEPELIAKGIKESVTIMALFNLFFLIASIFFARESIVLVAGDRWLEAASVLPWLIGAELFLAISALLQQAIIARGHTEALVKRNFVGLMVQWVSVIVLFKFFGFVGIAMGIAVGLFSTLCLMIGLVRRAGIFPDAGKIIKAVGAVFVLALLFGFLLSLVSHSLIYLVLKLILFACIYGLLVWLLARGEFIRIATLLVSLATNSFPPTLLVIFKNIKHKFALFSRSLRRLQLMIAGKPIIHVFGDSHVLFMQDPRLVLHHLGPVTAHNLINPKSTTQGGEKVLALLRRLKPKYALFVLGEIDCRIHINRISKTKKITVNQAIQDTVSRYGTFLLQVKKGFPDTRVLILNVLPPGEQGNRYNVTHYPSRTLRLKITRQFNHYLSRFCDAEGLIFIEVFEPLIDDQGRRKPEFVFEDAHYNKKTCRLVLEALKNYL